MINDSVFAVHFLAGVKVNVKAETVNVKVNDVMKVITDRSMSSINMPLYFIVFYYLDARTNKIKPEKQL